MHDAAPEQQTPNLPQHARTSALPKTAPHDISELQCFRERRASMVRGAQLPLLRLGCQPDAQISCAPTTPKSCTSLSSEPREPAPSASRSRGGCTLKVIFGYGLPMGRHSLASLSSQTLCKLPSAGTETSSRDGRMHAVSVPPSQQLVSKPHACSHCWRPRGASCPKRTKQGTSTFEVPTALQCVSQASPQAVPSDTPCTALHCPSPPEAEADMMLRMLYMSSGNCWSRATPGTSPA
mmetsp:Transcript_82210/g.266209  ORF Transcript_82210/g.266209 Transcript_82210/m.266209 type:complete len:237 (-) Transcript_82210:506-1216(-)